MTPRWFRTGMGLAVVVAVSVGACGDAVAEPGPAGGTISERGGEIPDCDELSEEIADLVVAAADHAASRGGGLPPAALEADHPEEFDGWRLATALADGSDELEARVEAAGDAAETLDCAPGPLHEVVDATVKAELQQDGSMSATWQVDKSFDVVADYYLDALQEGRLGGWDVASMRGSDTQTADGESTGNQRLEVTGYGFTGLVTISSNDPGHVTVTAVLMRQDE